MRSGFTSNHFTDADGRPSGGNTYGNGFAVGWQNGPLGRDEERQDPNGAFVEDVIDVAIDRIEFYNNCGFSCPENEEALKLLRAALAELESRTKRRESLGIEGTHAIVK